jgi:nucleoside-diphosphate-sugar epimerase
MWIYTQRRHLLNLSLAQGIYVAENSSGKWSIEAEYAKDNRVNIANGDNEETVRDIAKQIERLLTKPDSITDIADIITRLASKRLPFEPRELTTR